MVSREERAVYAAVLERDQMMTYWKTELPLHLSLDHWLATNPWVCVARLLPPVLEPCSGLMERDHVHEHAGGTKAKRAPTTMDNLVILCHHHHQNGWATSHRPEIRDYIKEANERYQRHRGRHQDPG